MGGNNGGVRQHLTELFGRSDAGDDSGSGGESDDGTEQGGKPDDTTENTNMGHDFDTLAKRSAFDAQTLREIHENDHDQFEKIEQTIDANEADGGDGESGGDSSSNGDDDEDDDEDDDGGSAQNSANDDKLDQILGAVNSLDERVSDIESSQNEDRVERLAAQSETSRAELEDMSDAELDAFEKALGTQSPAANGQGQGQVAGMQVRAGPGANYGGQGMPTANESSDDDEPEAPMTVLAATEGGDD